jgi:hypothetical protein
MGLTLDSIFKPVNDFFSEKFSTGTNSPIYFRFDKLGSIVSDGDFTNPVDSNAGFLPSKAREKFSDIVNKIPFDCDDGLNIEFSGLLSIDSFYHGMISSALPFIPSNSSEQVSKVINDQYDRKHSLAVTLWDNLNIGSTSGLPLEIMPSLATPENWYDKSNGAWLSHSFEVSNTTSVTTAAPKPIQWKFKLVDAEFQKILSSKVDSPVNLNPSHLSIRPNIDTVKTTSRLSMMDNKISSIKAVTPAFSSVSRPAGNIRFSELNASDRIALNNELSAIKPVQEVRTNSFNIAFDWCIVNIERPWLFYEFLFDKSWYNLNASKGELSTRDSNGAHLSSITTSFIAIKNLKIHANWDANDIEASKVAVDFGPFKVDPGIVDMNLTHAGIQIIGWMLQRLPELPPNNDPNTKIN